MIANARAKVSYHWRKAKGHSLSIRTSVLVAERREPPGEFTSDLRIHTGQLALFRYKVRIHTGQLALFRYKVSANGCKVCGMNQMLLGCIP